MVGTMAREPRTAKVSIPEAIAAGLTVPERMMLFCVASDTDWNMSLLSPAV